jgi:uncharacterized phage-associated protein
MVIRLDILKLTQAAAVLLKRHNGFITRMRLLKLLYITDRELLAETRRPLTGDHPVAMDFGPVLTHTYDLLKGEATGVDVWGRYIQQVAPYTHRLAEDPGVGKLSKRELSKLDEVVQRYWWVEDHELSLLTHEFPEWKRNAPAKRSRKWIPTEHVLEAVGLGQDVERIKQDAQAEAELDALLDGAAQ